MSWEADTKGELWSSHRSSHRLCVLLPFAVPCLQPNTGLLLLSSLRSPSPPPTLRPGQVGCLMAFWSITGGPFQSVFVCGSYGCGRSKVNKLFWAFAHIKDWHSFIASARLCYKLSCSETVCVWVLDGWCFKYIWRRVPLGFSVLMRFSLGDQKMSHVLNHLMLFQLQTAGKIRKLRAILIDLDVLPSSQSIACMCVCVCFVMNALKLIIKYTASCTAGPLIGLGQGSIDWHPRGPWGWKVHFSKWTIHVTVRTKAVQQQQQPQETGGGEVCWRKLMILVAFWR